jgi:ubiquinone biosynthesis monooxygenase Coq7
MSQTTHAKRPLPGDFTSRTSQAAALRVNHAGEYGAQRIYAGQLAVLKNHACAAELKHMAAQEQVHLATFNRVLPEYGVRPTALMPLWHVGGWLLGAGSALLGARGAMACTVAVESVITAHYNEQLAGNVVDSALHKTIAQFRDEEMEHHAIGLEHDAEKTPLYAPLTATIRYVTVASLACCSCTTFENPRFYAALPHKIISRRAIICVNKAIFCAMATSLRRILSHARWVPVG